jgi:hypothetical protein
MDLKITPSNTHSRHPFHFPLCFSSSSKYRFLLFFFLRSSCFLRLLCGERDIMYNEDSPHAVYLPYIDLSTCSSKISVVHYHMVAHVFFVSGRDVDLDLGVHDGRTFLDFEVLNFCLLAVVLLPRTRTCLTTAPHARSYYEEARSCGFELFIRSCAWIL